MGCISKITPLLLSLSLATFTACDKLIPTEKNSPKMVLFIGADISGSFLKGTYFDNSLDFLAHYIYAHLNGLGGLEVPQSLFVGAIGGTKPNEPKSLFPIETFQSQSVSEIRQRLSSIFPKTRANPFTDFNAFFEQVASTVKTRKLVLKPISVIMISDGRPDSPEIAGSKFRTINLDPLENLSRNVTLRVLYTDAVTGMNWQAKIPRKRVKVWTQDAAIMLGWNDPKNMVPGKSLAQQNRFFEWIKSNVDFAVRGKRIN